MIRTIIALLLLCLPLSAQTWSFSLEADDIVIDPSASFTEAVLSTQGDTLGAEVTGWQLCFAYDPGEVSLFGLQPLTITTPSFFQAFFANTPTVVQGVTYGPGVGFAACLYDFALVNTLVADTLTPILSMQVASSDLAIDGTSVISFVGGLNLPGAFDTVNQLGFQTATVLNGQYDIPDFPASLTLVSLPVFTRGDVNQDGTRNLLDAVALLQWAFVTGVAPCVAAIDFNADGDIAPIVSVLELLGWMFQGLPDAPGGVCGQQSDLGLTCDLTVCP